MIRYIKYTIIIGGILSSINSLADSCCTANNCLKFKNKATYLCALKTFDLQSLGSNYINNANITNLHVINNNITDGEFTADNVIIEGNVNTSGTIIIDGEPFTPVEPISEITQYGYFALNTLAVVANNGIIPFDTTSTANGITNAAGVITFSEPGYYVVNFTATVEALLTYFRIVYDAAGARTPIANTNFASFGADGDFQLTGIAIIQIPTAGTTIGIQNFSGGARTLDAIDALPGVLASIQIAKLSNL